ncbi:hypothetical protein [Streptomyces sp. NRRL S-1813]|uniref:hypothetical protein n=1 Tax=Streptomyces sp. NRRL S-1813 TaxID=1463888 RepID=UPI0004C5367D|nr:hypothetical protein [Streptomyces sp. NRRL S-1813]
MNVATVDTYGNRTPDAEGWRGVPFRHPSELTDTAHADGGKHDAGPMPPEAPRDPAPQGGDGN